VRAALYVRVSTSDGRQHLENQTAELAEFAARQGWQVVKTYSDELSGRRGSAGRAGLESLLRDSHKGAFDVVLVSALDRLTREGIKTALHYISELRRAGVDFRSIREPFLQTVGPMGDLLVSMFAWFASYETTALRARIRSGLDRARLEGKKFGRPRVVIDRAAVIKLAESGASIRKIAAELGVARSTVQRIISGGGGDGKL